MMHINLRPGFFMVTAGDDGLKTQMKTDSTRQKGDQVMIIIIACIFFL